MRMPEVLRAHALAVVRCGAWALGTVLLVCGTSVALAQTSPAHGALPHAERGLAEDDRALADYLALLQRIAPASEAGARTYLAAVRLRWGQALDVAALRRVMASEGGDPVLMGMIRAAATQDHAARQQAMAQIRCPHEVRR